MQRTCQPFDLKEYQHMLRVDCLLLSDSYPIIENTAADAYRHTAHLKRCMPQLCDGDVPGSRVRLQRFIPLRDGARWRVQAAKRCNLKKLHASEGACTAAHGMGTVEALAHRAAARQRAAIRCHGSASSG